MPCHSDYIEPGERERELQRAAKLYMFALESLRENVPLYVKRAANNPYGEEDVIPELCNYLTRLKRDFPDIFESVVYARSKQARDLANWWEDHEEADRAREVKEEEELERVSEFKDAMDKLTANNVVAMFDITFDEMKRHGLFETYPILKDIDLIS